MKTSVLWLDQIKDRDSNVISIYDLAFSPDGNSLMVAADNKIYVYDINNGTLVQTLKGHRETVLSLTFSHDGKRFASGSADKQVIIWTSKMEGILKYSHNDAVRALQYNPKSHQLLSCTSNDFGLWSPEQKSVTKTKIMSPINCCCWNEDGTFFVLGLSCGLISIRLKNGEEKLKIDRKGAIWGVLFYKIKENEEMLAVVDWGKSLSFYDINGNQNFHERSLNYDPLFISMFSDHEFFLIGGSSKKVSIYTMEGVFLETIATHNSWVWTCKAHANMFAIGCQDGSLAVYDVSFMTAHSLYKKRYAYRDSMTDVVIQHLSTGEKVRIKCRDLVKKIAIYETTLAIQLPERVILYELSDESNRNSMNYRVKEKINSRIECSLLVLCASNLVLCQDHKLQSLHFSGQLEREWLFEAPIRYVKAVGGLPGRDSLLIGLKNGQILSIFLSSIFAINLIKVINPIRCVDLSVKRQMLAVIDDTNKCSVYDIYSKKLIYEESNVTSMAWNRKYEDLLCVAGQGFVGIKTTAFPIQLVNNEFSNKTFVIGFSNHQIFTLQTNDVIIQEISYSKLLLRYMERNMLSEAYQIACLNVTQEDWEMLIHALMSKLNLPIAQKCLRRTGDWSYLDLIHSHLLLPDAMDYTNKHIFLAKYFANRGLFSEAAKVYRKVNAEHLAVEMFNDLQMYEQAKDYNKSLVSDGVKSQKSTSQINEDNKEELPSQASMTSQMADIQTLSKLYLSSGEHEKAFQLITNTDIESIMMFATQLDKGEIKILNLIAEHLMSSNKMEQAIEVYRKMGDYRNLALTYIKNHQWEEAFKIANDIPQLKQDIYMPYALWLSENGKFIEAQQAFLQAGKMDESYRVLDRLLLNSVNENRFNDASYYSWLLANYFEQMSSLSVETIEQSDQINHYAKASKLYREADIYYVYHQIFKYIEEPFTSVYIEVLFNSALFLFHYIDEELPLGVSKVYILFALTKLGKSLGHYKLVRIAYKKLQTLRLPEKLAEMIEVGSIEIKTKPFVDAEDLALFCYRCSATNSLFNSRLNQCINCGQQFVQSFYSFDVLPLVEFEVDPNLSPDQFERILHENSLLCHSNGRSSSWSEQIDPGSQTLEIYSHDSLGSDSDEGRVKILSLSEEINEKSNLVVVKESHLGRLNQTNVVVVRGKSQVGQPDGALTRYYLNMMPEIGVSACANCHKFFYSDEYEFQILKNGKCPFCRK